MRPTVSQDLKEFQWLNCYQWDWKAVISLTKNSWEVYENVMVHVFTIQTDLRLRSNAYSRFFITCGTSTSPPKSSPGGFHWKQNMRLCVHWVNEFCTHAAQHFCGEFYFAVIIFSHYTETTDCSKPEMQFNGPDSGSLIPILFTLNYKSRQLPGKKKKILKVMQTFTFLQNSQKCFSSFLEHATSSNPWAHCLASQLSNLGSKTPNTKLQAAETSCFGYCWNCSVCPKIVVVPFGLTWLKIHGVHYCMNS